MGKIITILGIGLIIIFLFMVIYFVSHFVKVFIQEYKSYKNIDKDFNKNILDKE